MKKITKTQKIILGSSLALLTLVPVVAVVATSCSNHSKEDNSVQNQPKDPVDQTQNNQNIVSTTTKEIYKVFDEFNQVTSLRQINELLSGDKILKTLSLSSQDAKLESIEQNNKSIKFSVQLLNKGVFSQSILQAGIANLTVGLNKLTFNIQIDKTLTLKGTYVNTTQNQIDNLITSINQIVEKNLDTLTEQNVLSNLGLNSNQATIKIEDGAPINSNGYNYLSKTIIVTLKDNIYFKNDLVSISNKNETVNPNHTILTLTNIKTAIVSEKTVNVQMNLNDFANYIDKVSNYYSKSALDSNYSSQKIAENLKANLGYLNISFKENSEETTKNGVYTYDLSISPKQGCKFDNSNIQSWISGLKEQNKPTYNSDTQTITWKNIQTGIYTNTSNLHNINSTVFGVSSLAELKNKIDQLNKTNSLILTINKQVPTEKLADDAKLLEQSSYLSNNGIKLTFASKKDKKFEIINVDLTPSSISSIFGEDVNTLDNQYSQISSISQPSALITNNSLKLDNIKLDNLGLANVKKPVISSDSISQSEPIQKVFDVFYKTKDIESSVQKEVLYNMIAEVNAINQNWNQQTSVANTFINSTLKATSTPQTPLTGSITIEISNNTKTIQTIEIGNSLLNNSEQISVDPNGYVLVSYNFEGAKITPEAFRNENGWKLGYGFKGVKKTLITNKQQQQTLNTTVASDLMNLGQPYTINVALNGVANTPNYFDKKTQTIFDSYLSSLTKDEITKEISNQDNAIWKFIQLMGADVGEILTTLGNNPSLGTFLNSLSKPLTDVVSQITNNQELGNLVGGILSNQSVLQYLKNNQNMIQTLFTKLMEYLKESGALSKLIPSNISTNGLISNNLFVANTQFINSVNSDKNNLITLASSSGNNIVNDFLTLLKAYTQTEHFKPLISWLIGQVKNLPNSILSKQSLLEVLGKDIEPILNDVLSQTQSTQSTNAAWMFLNSIKTLLSTIEGTQKVKNIYDIKLFDILKEPEDMKAIINFMENGLKPFLEMVSPNSIQGFNKALSIINKVFSLIPTLHLQAPELIFKSLSELEINTGSSTEKITWQQLFDKYIQFNANVKVDSYDSATHKITYTNQLSFKFNANVSLNLSEIKKQLSDLTVGAITDAIGIDLSQKLPSQVTKFLSTEKIKGIKVVDLLPDTITVYKNDGAKFALANDNGYLIPTIVNKHVSWYTNNNMILNLEFKQTTDKLVEQLISNVENVSKKLVSPFLQIGLSIALKTLKGTITNFVESFTSTNYNFNGGWVNKMGIKDTSIINNFNDNVQDLNYKLLHNDKFDQAALRKILQDSNYSKDISKQITDMKGNYIYLNDPKLNEAVLENLFDKTSLQWINSKDLPDYLKPVVSVQYTTDKSLSLFGNKVVNISGQYVVQVKLPFKVLVSNDNGHTWYFTNTLSYTIPYNA